MAFVADSYNLTRRLPATVNCSRNKLMFEFVEVEDLHISDLHFLNCGLEVSSECLPYRFRTQAALLFVSVTSLVLENVSVRKSYGYGLLSCNSLAVSVVGCSFHCNNWRVGRMYPWVDICADEEPEDSSSEQTQLQCSGNALFVCQERITRYFISPSEINSLKIYSLNITSSDFTYGMSHGIHFPLHNVPIGGLGMYFKTRSLQQITIDNCTFISNKGASVVLYFDPPSIKSVLVINNCKFYDGESGGLHIWKNVRNQEDLDARIMKSKFFGNFGSGFYLHISILDDIITQRNRYYIIYPQMSHPYEQRLIEERYYIRVNIDSCNFSNNTGTHGSGMLFKVVNRKIQQKHIYNVALTVSRTAFERNIANDSGGGIFIEARKLERYWNSRLQLDFYIRGCVNECSEEGDAFITFRLVESNLTRNSATSGSALASRVGLKFSSYYSSLVDDFNFRKSLYDRNTIDKSVNVVIMINDSNFTENINTAVRATNTKMYFAGQVRFAGNSGVSGGAFQAIQGSYLHLNPYAQVYFINNSALQYGGGIKLAKFIHLDSHAELYLINNTALYGGGIAVTTDHSRASNIRCFIQVDGNISTSDAKVILMHNMAQKAGDSIYGGILDWCSNGISLLSVFEINGTQSQSEIASIPYKVCFCPNTFTGHSCQTTSNATVFRGQTFQKAVIGSGQYGYASPAVISISFLAGFTGELGERQTIQEAGRTCTNITLSIRTREELIKLELSVESPSIPFLLAVLTVSFLPCPFGFNLTGNPPKCDCANHLKQPGVNCSIDSQLVHRPAAVWIGNYSDDVVIHSHCPFDYCKPEDNEISLHQQDEQCALNRSRVLCGACQVGLSLALGSSRCMQCSNVWILLFILFAIAGVLLIVLLLKCNLTVSTGTINGLIFYANIIRVNHAIFFPPGKIHLITQLLSVFIAWVNLDLGIETCLFDGMNALIKTWLQFLFPIYIWVMVGLIIIVSRYSTTVSMLTGYNTVSVLATLFLLSFAKLLRAITATLSFITLRDRHGHTSAVWLLDGNVGLLKGAHISLFIGSLLALLGLVLPFSLLLSLAQFLQGSTHYHIQKLANKFKPLLDAYQGPYLDKFRFWTGFMLWVRIVLFIVFAGNALGDPQVNLLVITLLVLVLEALISKTGGIFRNSGNEMVERFFLLNLGIFAASTLFLRSPDNFSMKRQEILAVIMVGSAFSVFLGILTYRCYGYLKKVGVMDWMLVHIKLRPRHVPRQDTQPDAVTAEVNHDRAHVQAVQPTFTEIRLDQLRESLLTDN